MVVMKHPAKGYSSDYRVNMLNNGNIVSIEVTCCGKHIGEMRFKDGESKKCPACGKTHKIIVQYNHFHIRNDFNKEEAGTENA